MHDFYYMNILPDELLFIVFSYVDTYSLWTGVEYVCRRWNALAHDNLLYDRRLLCKKRYNNNNTGKMVCRMLNDYTRSQTLDGGYMISGSEISQVVSRIICPFCKQKRMIFRICLKSGELLGKCRNCLCQLTTYASKPRYCSVKIRSCVHDDPWICSRAIFDKTVDCCLQCWHRLNKKYYQNAIITLSRCICSICTCIIEQITYCDYCRLSTLCEKCSCVCEQN